jgi:hypothetical protein
VTHEGPEEYNNIWQKVRSIWKYAHSAYGRDFEWMFIGGDDLFVIPSNLRAYLHTIPTDEPVFLGRRFQIPGSQLFNSGGAGYGLNRKALQLLVDNLDNPKVRGAARADLMPTESNCLAASSVPASPEGVRGGRKCGALPLGARGRPLGHERPLAVTAAAPRH